MSGRRELPIGIFDSGIGGLTVAHEIEKILPGEQILYFGDSAHMPYGDKSIDLIRSYALSIADFLINKQHCKALVIACNTASAAAYEVLRDELKGNIPVINVIDPMVEYIISKEEIHHVGLIATSTTVKSNVYQEKFSRRKPKLLYSALATPLLAPMIEEGFYNDHISDAILHQYLDDPQLAGIDTLVLACTHYPLIKKEISAFFQHQIVVVDSAEVVATKLKQILKNESLENLSGAKKTNRFYVSDLSSNFEKTTRIFYGENIQLEYYWPHPVIL
ncbi:MAG TPA: glutamate racemase [Saprospiraceae bacterium]|nr:glutamate racemase [Saprospiraceae bacterium]